LCSLSPLRLRTMLRWYRVCVPKADHFALLRLVLCLLLRRPRRSTLFPYTTLFRSQLVLVTKLTAVLNEESGVTAPNSIGLSGNTDRKSTRLNSSHVKISYAVFCLKKKTIHGPRPIITSTGSGAEMVSRKRPESR